MANQIINVIVNSKGAVTVARELNAIGDSARQTTTYLNGLRAILASALTFSGVGQIVEAIDTFTVLQNRLKLVTDEANTLGDSWTRLNQIANSSYSTIDSTVTLYYRVAQAYKAWGESAEDAYEFTDLFQKSAILSGSSMETTAQAVYQFGQALNKGKLDGDEFRSVLEGLPYVATLIQKELGVTRAELYKMSAEGKISLDRIKGAFTNASKSILEDWGSVTPTIGMALNIFRNQWINFIGDIQNSTGVFSLIASGIILVANNFYLLAAALTPVALSLAYLAGRMVIGLVVTGFVDMAAKLRPLIAIVWAFNVALMANPLLWIPTAIIAVIAAIVYFRNELGLTDAVLATIGQKITMVFSSLMTFFSPLGSMIAAVVAKLLEFSVVFTVIKQAASLLVDMIAAIVNIGIQGFTELGGYLSKTFAPVWKQLAMLAREYWELCNEIVGLFMTLFGPAIEFVHDKWKAFAEYAEPATKIINVIVKELFSYFRALGQFIQGPFAKIIKDAFEGWIIILDRVLNVVRTIIQALRNAIALMKQAITGSGAPGAGGGATANYGLQGYAGEFNSGGGFKVGGTGGGRDTTPVSFRANRGERVTVETKKQQRTNDNYAAQPANVNVPIQVVNVFDPAMIPAAMGTQEGQRQIINTLVANRDEIIYKLGVS